jgi:iron-sulfur cluster assembly accessory protein
MPINIEITQKAQDEICQLLSNEKEGSFFRISVQGGGCSGFKYNFIIDTKINEDDLKVGAVVIDSTSLQYLKGSTLEYNDSLIEKSFKIKNPNAKSSCGCGTSFSI